MCLQLASVFGCLQTTSARRRESSTGWTRRPWTAPCGKKGRTIMQGEKRRASRWTLAIQSCFMTAAQPPLTMFCVRFPRHCPTAFKDTHFIRQKNYILYSFIGNNKFKHLKVIFWLLVLTKSGWVTFKPYIFQFNILLWSW